MTHDQFIPITLASVRVGSARVAGDGRTVTAVVTSQVLADALRLDTTTGLALSIVSGPQPCPECMQGKHQNCDGGTWDEVHDEPAPCPCSEVGHVGTPTG